MGPLVFEMGLLGPTAGYAAWESVKAKRSLKQGESVRCEQRVEHACVCVCCSEAVCLDF